MRRHYDSFNRSQKTAFWIVIVAAAYLLLANLVFSTETDSEARIALSSDKDLQTLIKTETLQAQEKQLNIVLYGATEANRSVKLKAQIEGEVAEILIPKGSFAHQGDVILKVDERDRKARLAQAEALVKQRENEIQAARKLVKTGAQSQVRALEVQANYEEAKAQLAEAREAYENTIIRAPFCGVVENISVEEGDLVGQGFVVNGDDSVATIVEYNPLVVSGQIPQQKRAELRVGDPATVRLIDKREIPGRIRFIGTVTDPNTRTFRVEVEIPNLGGVIPVGVSAELLLPTNTAMAYHVSPSVLSLNDDGDIGIKAVDEAGMVVFHPVELLEDSAEGVWIGGLPDPIRLITLGHNFVSPGQKVPLEADRASTAQVVNP